VILAADIGGTKIAAARVHRDGGLDQPPLQIPTPAQAGPGAVLAATVDLLSRLDPSDAELVAVASAGVIDHDGRVIAATDSLPGWAGTPLADHLRNRLGRPAYALGDGHAFAVGEARYGVGRGHSSLLMLAIGTGIGGSYLVDGMPLLGAHAVAGHVGHLSVPEASELRCPCGRTGHLEAVGSGTGILAWYHHHGGDPAVTNTRDLVASSGDDLAAAALAIGAAAVGTAAGSLANVLDPDLVVIAGAIATTGARWEHPMRAAFAAAVLPALAGLPLVISTGGTSTALRGAAAYAQHRSQT
jgi:glucokinase